MNDSPIRNSPAENVVGDAQEMIFDTAEYPQLDGLQDGSPVTVTCEGTVSKTEGGQVTLSITDCQFKTEGQVDRDYRDMNRQDSMSGSSKGGPSVNGDDF